jgi:hypothetical protein
VYLGGFGDYLAGINRICEGLSDPDEGFKNSDPVIQRINNRLLPPGIFITKVTSMALDNSWPGELV